MEQCGARDEAGTSMIGNAFLELGFQKKGDRVAATVLINRVSGRTIQLADDDFSLSFEGQPTLHASDFSVQEVAKEKIPGGQNLTFQLVQRGGTAKAALVYELLDNSFFLRRHLEYSPVNPLLLRTVEVWKLGIEGRCSSQETGPPEEMLHNVWGVDRKTGFGKPVFLEDTFWGLEYPAGYNHYASGYLSLSHQPGREISGKFISKTAVLGVATNGLVANRFKEYISASRPGKLLPEVQVDYNTWTTVSPATEVNSLGLIEQFKTNLFEPFGVGFDSFTLDDGWDEKNSLWEMRTNGFPNGFKPLLNALQPMGTKLGLWLSPSSGYEHAAWGGKNGFTRNATFDWFLCQSDPAYRREMSRVVPELIQHNDLGFFKMDGFCASCDTPRHPHHLDGDFAREANVDAFIELITRMREAKPGVYLDPTSGMWLSPWWLWYVDSVYADTYDGTAPALVPSPNGFDGATSIRDALLRRRLAANPGFDPGAVETLGVYLDPTLAIDPASFFDNWQDNAMMVAGRGNRLLTFYLNPAKLPNPAKDWPFLAELIRWARTNAATLARTEMVLGDPYRMEAYGYAHFLGHQGILTLRNPFIQPKTVRLKLNESCGWNATEAGMGKYIVSTVFPFRRTMAKSYQYGELLELQLQPYQTLIVQIEPQDESSPAIANVRTREINRSSNSISWEVYGLPGSKLSTPLLGLPKPKQILWDGSPISTQMQGAKPELPLTFGKTASRCAAEGGLLQPDGAYTARLAGNTQVTIPKGTRAFVYALCLDPAGDGVNFDLQATINGNRIPDSDIKKLVGSKSTLRPVKELPLKPWVFFRFAVPEGQSEIKIALEAIQANKRILEMEAGWWLWTEQPLQKAILSMEFDQALPTASTKTFPFPSTMETQRQVIPLQALTTFSLWSKPAK